MRLAGNLEKPKGGDDGESDYAINMDANHACEIQTPRTEDRLPSTFEMAKRIFPH
jgi:hypothetical protein